MIHSQDPSGVGRGSDAKRDAIKHIWAALDALTPFTQASEEKIRCELALALVSINHSPDKRPEEPNIHQKGAHDEHGA